MIQIVFLHFWNYNSWDYFIHFHENFQCHYVSISLLCHYNRDDSKVSCCENDIICVILGLLAICGEIYVNKKPLDVNPVVNIGQSR